MTQNNDALGYMRLAEILTLFPVSKSTWWEGVRIHRYPQPIKIGPRMTAWRKSDITKLLEDPEKNNHFPD